MSDLDKPETVSPGLSDQPTGLPTKTSARATAPLPKAASKAAVTSLSATQRKEDAAVDPAVALWHQWKEVHRSKLVLRKRQQQLEKKLLQLVGRVPQMEIQVPGKAEPVRAFTMGHLDTLLPDPEMRAARQKAKAVMLKWHNVWSAADIETGYSAAYDAEIEAAQRETVLEKALWATPAQSIAGVAAKVQLLIEIHVAKELRDPTRDMSVPELRLILADLVRIETDPPGV